MKSILVIDMPQDCLRCPCYRQAHYEYLEDCKVALRPLTVGERDNRPSYCPLKPMPQKKEVHYTDPMFGEVTNLINIGYNQCLKEIMGEEL